MAWTLTAKSLNASSDSFGLRHTTKNRNPTYGRDDNNQQRHDDVFQHDDNSVKATSIPEAKSIQFSQLPETFTRLVVP
jgi:hypothetical protein